MRAILAYILLAGVLCQEPPLLKAPILDRMSSNGATPMEKKQVFTQLKNIINSAQFPWYKANLHKVVKVNAAYMYSVDVGGDVGAKALEELKEIRTKSENPQNVLDFLEICMEFMNKNTIPDTSKWWFFNEATILMNRGYKLEEFNDFLIRGDWILPVNVLEALEILYRTPTEVLQPYEIPKIPSEMLKNVYVAPTNPMFGPITLLGYKKLNDDWEAEPFQRIEPMLLFLTDDTSAKYSEYYLYYLKGMIEGTYSRDGVHYAVLLIERLQREEKDQYLEALFDLRNHEEIPKLMENMGHVYYLTNGSEFDSYLDVFRDRHSGVFLHFFDVLKTTPEMRFRTLVQNLKKISELSSKLHDAQFPVVKKFLRTATDFSKLEAQALQAVLSFHTTQCERFWNFMRPDTKEKIRALVEELREKFKVSFCVKDA